MGSGRGGRRSGAPGAAYPQRTDLNVPTQSITNRPGGGGSVQGGVSALHAATQAVPTAPGGYTPQGGVAAPSGPLPQQVTPLSAPTQHPDEPLTAGLPTGAGAGPDVLSTAGQAQQDLAGLRQYLPLLRFHAQRADTPQSVINLTKYLESLAP